MPVADDLPSPLSDKQEHITASVLGLIADHALDEQLRILTDLRLIVDRHTEVTVARCRRAGLSWSAIGASLGTTRQAAHQRFSGDIHKAAFAAFVDELRQSAADEGEARALSVRAS